MNVHAFILKQNAYFGDWRCEFVMNAVNKLKESKKSKVSDVSPNSFLSHFSLLLPLPISLAGLLSLSLSCLFYTLAPAARGLV